MKPLNVMTSPFFLVYPPVSNQEAEWVTNDREVEKLLRTSDLYMIAMRAEATFTLPPTQEGSVMRIEITTGDTLTDVVELDIEVLAANTFGVDNIPDDLEIRLGPKIIKLFADATEDDIDSERVTPFEWFSTEKLIYDFGRRKPGISGFRRHRDFATYRLLYVGIARKTDTFARLFKGAHEKRQKILGNEYPNRPNARVTDEMFLFAWATDPLVLRSIENPDDFLNSQNEDWDAHYKAVIADAEKAFVHLLNPQYNSEKFASYPRGTDGLYGYGYEGHSFTLAENISFEGASATMHGSWLGISTLPSNDADIIVTKGNTVALYENPNMR